MSKPRVVVIGTGGTISSIATSRLDVIDYAELGRKMDAAEIIQTVPELSEFAECIPVAFRAVSSTAIGPSEWKEMADIVTRMAAQDHDLAGFVIPHGTGTIEESAYALHLTLKTNLPVVFVGAQRPSSAVGTDAHMNLLAAVRVAASPASRGRGVLVVLNDEIHSARETTKRSTYRVQTFESPDFGLLGHVDGDAVVFYRTSTRRHTVTSAFSVADLAALPRVDVVYSYAGADGVAIDAFLQAGAKGLVSAAFAPGIPTPEQRTAFERAVSSGVVVAQSTRAGSGRVARRNYLTKQNMVAADNLNPQKARILLALALTKTSDPLAIQEIFNDH